MSHDIVIFKIVFLGNIFGDFPKVRVPETIDFTRLPNLFPEINENGKLKNIFGEIGKSVFGKDLPFSGNFLFLGNAILGKRNLFLGEIAAKIGGAYAKSRLQRTV